MSAKVRYMNFNAISRKGKKQGEGVTMSEKINTVFYFFLVSRPDILCF